MLYLSIKMAAGLHRYLRRAPTNIVLDWLRSPQGRKWAIPVAVVLVPAYLFAASICTTILGRGGPGWLNVLVLLFIWNALKFAVMAPTSLILLARSWMGAKQR